MSAIGKLWASGPVVAETVRENGKLLQDVYSFSPGDLSFGTAEYGGAGMLGTLDIPATGQLESAELTLNAHGRSEQSGQLATPGKHKFVLSGVQDVLEVNNDKVVAHRGIKVNITCIFKNATYGDVEAPNTIDGSYVYEILRYEEFVSGKEILLWDKLNYILRVGGKDQVSDISSML